MVLSSAEGVSLSKMSGLSAGQARWHVAEHVLLWLSCVDCLREDTLLITNASADQFVTSPLRRVAPGE